MEPSQAKIRLTLDVTPAVHARLQALVETVGAESQAQVLREALRLYEYTVQQYQAGHTFLVRTAEGKECALVLLSVTP